MTDIISDTDLIVGDFIILFYGDLYNGLSTDMYNQYLWPLWLYKHLMIFYGRYFLDWDFDHFRSGWIASDYIRSAPVTTDYQKIAIWKSKSKKTRKKWKYGLCMFIKETDCWTNSRNASKIIFILNYSNL